VETGTELRRIVGVSSVSDLAVLPDDRRVLAADGQQASISDLATGKLLQKLPVAATCVAVSANGRRGLLGHDLVIELWDLESAESIVRLEGHTQMVGRVGFSPDGYRAVSTSLDKTVRIWELPLPGVAERQASSTDEATARKSNPISPRTQAILDTLEQNIPMNFMNEPLDEILTYVKHATFKGKKPTDPGLPIYVDPLVERKLTSKVQVNLNDAPLRLTLSLVLDQAGLAYLVKDDVLIISSPQGIDQERADTASPAADSSPRTKRVLAKLEEPIPMSFADPTPLDDLPIYIRQATTSRGDDGIPIFTDPHGLQEAGCSLTSPVSIDLNGVPLKTTLRLMLKRLGLAYTVKDGQLMISSDEGIRKWKGRLGAAPLPAADPKQSDRPQN
jgi:hypothetical protein